MSAILRYLPALALLASACVSPEENIQIGQEVMPLNLPNGFPFLNPDGLSSTVSTLGSVDLDNEFLQEFGTNDRTCVHCHLPNESWAVSATGVQLRFLLTRGRDPIFRLVDGANSPNADVSTLQARKEAYSMLLSRGVIRVGLPMPATAEFELVAVDDPYGFASAAELSLFRKPLPSATLTVAPAVMWDGRETGPDLFSILAQQSNNATLGHAQASSPLPVAARESIVDFETALFNAQIFDFDAGWLDEDGALGGPTALSTQAEIAAPFNLFDAWADLPGTDDESLAREAIARGQALFNTKPNAGGGTCRGCHNLSNIGTSANPIFFDINISDVEFHEPDFPLYTLRRLSTGELKETSDPGRAMITGLWNDIGRFKTPTLRGLSARAPYFHNGIAATLADVVTFYEQSLGFNFTPAEEADLVAFLKAL